MAPSTVPGPAELVAAIALASSVALAGCTSGATGGACGTTDQDGVSGGTVTLDLTVGDSTFTPKVLEAENLANVSLTLRNAGTRPHGFRVTCLATPNDRGCPAASCFADASTIAPLLPGSSATVTFVTPNPEGIYVFGSSAAGDSMTGQFIVQ